MMRRKPYFPEIPGAPKPLRESIRGRVRFEEVDFMRIVWHGRYISYFEEARVAHGRKYGIGYADFIERRCPAPIKRLEVDYIKPLQFDEAYVVEAMLHWTEAARINYEFRVSNGAGELVCTGCSVQLMLDQDLSLLLSPPPFYQAFLEKWRAGELE